MATGTDMDTEEHRSEGRGPAHNLRHTTACAARARHAVSDLGGVDSSSITICIRNMQQTPRPGSGWRNFAARTMLVAAPGRRGQRSQASSPVACIGAAVGIGVLPVGMRYTDPCERDSPLKSAPDKSACRVSSSSPASSAIRSSSAWPDVAVRATAEVRGTAIVEPEVVGLDLLVGDVVKRRSGRQGNHYSRGAVADVSTTEHPKELVQL
jgi:hypothetical protein